MRYPRNLHGMSGDQAFKLATGSALLFFCLFFLGIILSLLSYTKPVFIVSTLVSHELGQAIMLSLSTATISTVLSMALGVPAAYALSHSRFRGKEIVDTILDLPIVVSPAALGAALLVFFNTPIGIGIEKHLTRFVFEVPGIVLAQFTVVSALSIRLMKSTFDGIDYRYEQVGRTLGCGKWSVFFRITLPMAKNGLVSSCILTWARAFGEYSATIILAGAMRPKTETLPVAIFLSLSNADIEKAIAVIFILIGVAAIALLILRAVTKKGYPA